MPEPTLTTAEKTPSPPGVDRKFQRIASIDWMRGLVMVLMVIDHASMAFDKYPRADRERVRYSKVI